MGKRLKSRTYWLSASTIVIGALAGNPQILGPYLGEHITLVMFLLGVAGMVVREFTEIPIEEK